MKEDATDIFDTSLSNLFSIPPIAFSTSSPTDLHTYHPPSTSTNKKPVQLKLPHPPPSLYTTLQANHLWLASIYLSDILCQQQIDVKGKRVAELGAGAGLPGLIACRNGAQVVSSDWGVEEVTTVIEGNFERDRLPSSSWAVIGHQWGTDLTTFLSKLTNQTGGQQFDMLLLADTLWVTAAHQALLDSVYGLLKPGGTAHITAGLHTGRGPLERFIAAAEARGGIVEKVREVRWLNEGGWEDNSGVKDGLEEERGVVVHYTLTTRLE